MGTLLDLASLVVVPSGYKEDKIYSVVPTDGSGDLDFTRASNATRVNSAGLIEKVRTNLLLQSNTFSTTWLFSGTGTVTQGVADPFGGTTAWTLAKTAANTFLYQSTSGITGSATFSIYAKAGTVDQLWLNHDQSGSFSSYFDLTLGTAISPTGCVATIVSVGGGWYRCSIAGTSATPNNLRIYPASGGSIAGTTGNILIYGAQGETGDIATDYIPTTSAAVSVGMTANVPRLDYLGSSCPSLLLEPQRTNLFTYSEQINDSSYVKFETTITANNITSPDGFLNADKITPSVTSANHRVVKTITSGLNTTISVFAKAGGYDKLFIGWNIAQFNQGILFNLTNGTFSNAGSIFTASIENYGNGWYRCSITTSSYPTTSANFAIVNNLNQLVFAGDGTSGIYFWGAQNETGPYPTSYIPTLGTSVTRVADAAIKTGISSLIGQTEGVLFLDFVYNDQSAVNRRFSLSDGTSAERIFFILTTGGLLGFNGTDGSVDQFSLSTTLTVGERYKIAGAYKEDDIVLYVNGTQVGSDTSATIPSCSNLYFANESGSTQEWHNPTNQLLLFPTRLTNTQLAELTTL